MVVKWSTKYCESANKNLIFQLTCTAYAYFWTMVIKFMIALKQSHITYYIINKKPVEAYAAAKLDGITAR